MITAVYNITDFEPHYYNVHILIDGEYAGIGRFCEDYDEMIAFCRYHHVESLERLERR